MDVKTPVLSRRQVLAGLGALPAALAFTPDAEAHHSHRYIQRLIVRETLRMNAEPGGDRRLPVPPALALAVAKKESNFNPRALGKRPHFEVGIFQILPRTGWTEYGLRTADLWDPVINTRVGVNFLGRLLHQYHGYPQYALSHYNGGSRVRTHKGFRVIPATRVYVNKVLRLNSFYQRELDEGLI